MDEQTAVYATNASKLSEEDAAIIASTVDLLAGPNGVCTARALLDASRAEDAPTHRYFEWDDQKAAEEHRVAQARSLIRAIRFVADTRDGEIEQHAFHAVKLEGSRGYVSAKRVVASRDMADQVIKASMQRLAMWRMQHANLRSFLGDTLFQAIDEAIAKHGRSEGQGGSPAAPPG
jgi:hypothetical protein